MSKTWHKRGGWDDDYQQPKHKDTRRNKAKRRFQDADEEDFSKVAYEFEILGKLKDK